MKVTADPAAREADVTRASLVPQVFSLYEGEGGAAVLAPLTSASFHRN